MWRSHLLVALRALARHRLFTVLNLAGLAVGMAAALMIARWVAHETRHDAWVPALDRTAVLMSRVQYAGQEPALWRHSPGPMLPRFAQDFAPQIEAWTRLLPARRAVRLDQRVENQAVLLVDPGFLEVLPYPLREGRAETALRDPGSLVVTEGFARRWFGPGPALGRTLLVTVRGEPRPYRVAAVLQDPPSASLVDFELAMRLDPQELPVPAQLENWGSFNPLALVRLRAAADAAVLRAGADGFVQRHAPQFERVEQGFRYRPEAVPLARAHLHPVQVAGPGRPPGDPALVAAIGATGLLVLLIATITYVNLATARVSLRAREVGLRKTLGATRGELVRQFLLESTLLAALAGFLALVLVELALPGFNALLGQRLDLPLLGADGVLLPLAAMVLVVGLAGGWYPALVLARQPPRQALAGQAAAAGGGGVRSALVVGQFVIAVTLLGVMAVIQAQVRHLRAADMGYEPRGLVLVQALHRSEVRPRQDSLLEAYRRTPGVRAVTRSLFEPGSGGISRQPAYLPGVPEAQAPQLSTQPIDWDYVRTYGARLLAGRDLSRDVAGDDAQSLDDEALARRGVRVLVSRAALPLFGTREPQAVLGRSFHLNGENGRYAATVVGVLEDIRLRSARERPEPTFFARDAETMTSIALRFDAALAPAEQLARAEATWRAMFPDVPFVATTAADAIAGQYQAETRAGHLFALFAGLAVALCAVGVYGLAVFTAERRTREIALRKLLGARVRDILALLLWQFSRPVLLAIVLAAPLWAWIAARWLDRFAERIPLGPAPFLVAAGLALLLALATVAGHALKAARARPVTALRADG